MAFTWPLLLISLLLVPALAGAYAWALRRRRRRAVRFSSIALIRAARPPRSAWRRHAPVALLLAALACLGLASARPQVRTAVPVSGSAVILAIDVSGSMCSTDVDPNRLSAAQAAVRTFVRAQDPRTRVGLVVFSGFAELAVAPTTERDPLLQAVDSLTTGRGTTIGAAILKAVDAISQIDPTVAPADDAAAGQDSTDPATGTPTPTPSSPPAAHVGGYAPEIVVLLTDGANTTGISPADAAKQASARGVRVYPIGFGTTHPTRMVCTAQQLGGPTFENGGPGGFGGYGGGLGGGLGGGRRNFLVADEGALREVATTTGGTYFAAQDARQLQAVLADLPRHVDVQQQETEVSAVLAGLAALLVLVAAAAAARWTAFPS